MDIDVPRRPETDTPSVTPPSDSTAVYSSISNPTTTAANSKSIGQAANFGKKPGTFC